MMVEHSTRLVHEFCVQSDVGTGAGKASGALDELGTINKQNVPTRGQSVAFLDSNVGISK